MKRKYDDDFKRNTVQKVLDGQSAASVARELGIGENLIYNWKKAILQNGNGIQSSSELTEIAALKKRNRELEMEVEILKKGDAYLRQRKLKRYKFIDDEQENYPIKILCRVMEVSPSGYYAWRKRQTIPPRPRRKNLAYLVKNCYFENRRRYGVRRITASINKDGVKIGKFQVRQLMKEQSLVAIRAKKFVPKTTDSKGTCASPNLLKEIKIEDGAPTKIIIGDITYIPLQNGSWCYLAIWQDKVTRRIIGWSLAATMTAELVISALGKAIRHGLVLAGAIIHSDRGSQYASNDFRELLRKSGFRQSMSGKGNCYDNAQAESFFSRFKAELIEGGAFENVEEARSEIFSYIEGYYNRVRLHSSLDNKSPMEFEDDWKLKNGGKIKSFLSTKT